MENLLIKRAVDLYGEDITNVSFTVDAGYLIIWFDTPDHSTHLLREEI